MENNTIEETIEIEETSELEAAEAAEAIAAELKENATGVIDVIGLDVLRLNKRVDTIEEAETVLKEYTETAVDILQVGDSTFVIRATLADLNKVNALIPEDLDSSEAIPIQIKISEILQKAGLNIGINDEMQAALEEEMAAAREEFAAQDAAESDQA